MKDWSVTASSGGRYPAIDPVFFSDRTRLALATALAIKVYQLSTKQVIAKVAIDCNDATQLVLSSDETDFLIVRKSGSVERIGLQNTAASRLNVDPTVRIKRLVSEISENKFLAIVGNQKGMHEIGELDFTEAAFTSFFESKVAHAESGIFAVSVNTRIAAFMHPKSGKIELVDLKSRQSKTISGANKSQATSLAVSDSGLVAVGNASGVVDIIYPDGGGLRSLKWHLEPVRALKFATGGEYLLSGGSERVLVFWQLATNRQQFLPRLDGTICSICSNSANTLYGLTLSDSQLVIISAVDLVSRLHVAGTKAEFTKLPPDHQVARRRRRKRADLDMWAAADYTTPLEIHPGTRSAYLLAANCQAQVFSLARDDQEGVVSLARTLDTGKVRRELNIPDPTVSLLKFTPDGRYMITVDTQQNPGGLLSSSDRITSLKFWATVDGAWTVVTRVVSPHGTSDGSEISTEVCDLAAHGERVVTAGADGSLRMWRLTEDGTWSLRHIMPAFAAHTRYVSVAWSADGSVLALAHEMNVYLTDPHKLRIVKQLPNIAGSPVRGLVFARSSLVVLSRSRLVAFNLVSMAQRWAIELKTPAHGARLLAVDPVLGRIAIAINYWTYQYRVNSRVILLDPSGSPVPIQSFVHPFAIGSVSLIPGTNSYCFIDQRGVLCTLSGPANAIQKSDMPNQNTARLTNTLVSLYTTRQNAADAEMDTEEGATQSLDVNTVGKLFDTHASVEQLFDQMMTLVS